MSRRYRSMNYVYSRSDGNLELRYPIPEKLRRYFPKANGLDTRKWIGGSLGTKDSNVANRTAAEQVSRYEKLFAFLRDEVPDDQLTAIFRFAYEFELQTDLDRRLSDGRSTAQISRDAEDLSIYLRELQTTEYERQEAVAGWLADVVQENLSQSLILPRDTPLRRRLVQMSCDVLIDATRAKIARSRGIAEPPPRSKLLVVNEGPEPGENIPLTSEGRLSVRRYFEAFLERWRKNSPRERTVERRTDAWREFSEVVGGDTPIFRIKKADLWRYHALLQDYPTRANSRRELKELSFLQQVEAARAEPGRFPTLDANTIGDRLRHVGAVFRDAARRGDLQYNPADGVSESKSLDSVARPPYSVAELNAILSLAVFKPAPPLTKRDEHFWVPLLELFSGARPSELYLPMQDVREDDEIPHFLLEPFEDRQLKTPASARWVPIHSDLIKAGFLDYCRRMRSSGARLLFPDWDFEAGLKPSEAPARRRFNRMLAQVVDPARRFKDSYTFRSTFETALSSSPNVSERIARKLTGRALEGSARHYVDRIELAALRDAIEEVRYAEVDRSHLRVGG